MYMDYLLIISIVLLFIVVVLLLYVAFKKNDNKVYNKELEGNIKDILNSKIKEINNDFNNFTIGVGKHLDGRINTLTNNLNNKLDDSFKETKTSFNEMLKSVEIIKVAQDNINHVSNNLKNILLDKKTRGVFGEMQLANILYDVFGNTDIYELQKTIGDEGAKVDCLLHSPEPLGDIAIDSKFPLENYQKMDSSLNIKEKEEYKKAFIKDCKKHILDIKSKYIIKGVTSDKAIMFIPSEAIFSYIASEATEVIEEGYKNNVWITSPSTLMAYLTTLYSLLENIKYEKNINIVVENIKKLNEEFKRFKDRFDNLTKDIDKVSKDVSDISITSKKIQTKFSNIVEGELSDD